MAASWKPSSTYATALVAKSPEASSSQWDPPTVTRRPQNGLSPTNPPPLLLAAADLQRGSCQVSLWASRHCVCCSQAHPSKVGVSVARVTDPRRTRLGQSQICPSSHSHCHAQMFQVPSRLLWVCLGWAAWWPACDPYRPPPAFPSYLPVSAPHIPELSSKS